MERDLAGAVLSEDDFERLSQLCRHDRKFPRTYEAWTSLVATGAENLLADGQPTVPISVVVPDFATWCQRVEVMPCLDALRAYLIVLRSTEADTEPEGTAPSQKAARAPRLRRRSTRGGLKERLASLAGRAPRRQEQAARALECLSSVGTCAVSCAGVAARGCLPV